MFFYICKIYRKNASTTEETRQIAEKKLTALTFYRYRLMSSKIKRMHSGLATADGN